MKIDRKISLILVAVILLSLLVFYYVVGGGTDTQSNSSDNDFVGADQSGANRESLQLDVITAEHSYEEGLHTVSGEIDLPNPCYELLVETEIRESYPEQVLLNFYQLNTASPDLVCAQVITPRSFNVSFSASQEAEITAKTGDRSLDLRLMDLE